MKKRRLLALALLIAGSVLATVVAAHFGNLTRLDDLEQKTLDWRQITTGGARPSGTAESPVVLVFFDRKSIDSWPYLSPFPRAFLADLIQAVSGAGARTIGLDVYLDRLYPRLNRMDGGDDRLRDAIAKAGNVVLVAPTEVTDSGPVLEPPADTFADVAAGVGAADLPTAFETIREAPLAVRSRQEIRPSFALSLYASYRGLDVDSLLRAARTRGTLGLPGLPASVGRLPKGWRGTGPVTGSRALDFPLRYLGPPSDGDLPGTFPAYRASEAASLATFAPEFFRNKIVLLGTGWHDTDKFQTPYYGYFPAPDSAVAAASQDHYGYMFGVEVHANALQDLLDGTFVRPMSPLSRAGLLLLVATMVAGAVFLGGAMWGGGVALLAALLTWSAAYWAYAGSVYLPFVGTVAHPGGGYLWVPVVTPFLAVVLAYLSSTAYVSIVEGREKRFIRGAMGKYVPPAVVEEIARNPDTLRLGGQKRLLSLVFSDLAGFTSLSETMEPEALLTLLNEYLSVMTGLVMAEEGTLDKYMGDGIMAFWNAPKPRADHADRALRCAVLMEREMRRLNRKWEEEGRRIRPFRVRVGVNTGEVVVGNVGGEERFDYSAVGDPVNLAARLEPANKTYGTLIMASEFTVARADSSAYHLRELDLIAVKGKTEPVTVYEVLELADHPLEEGTAEALEHYAAGLAAFRNRDWELAAQYFAGALESRPDDGPSQVYLERSRSYVVEPPPTDWDFVVRRNVK